MNPGSDKEPHEKSEEERLSKVDFGKYFHKYGIDYSIEAPWMVVGKLSFDKKWIFFLSVLERDVKPLLDLVLPVLFLHKLSFRVLQNYEYVRRLNGMWMGLHEVGKVVTISLPDERTAVMLAKELVRLTGDFKAPIVQDALRLGAILYANICEIDVNESNEPTGFISNYLPPASKIPFKIERVYKRKKRKGIIGRYYLPIRVIQPNTKGDIVWGVNLKKWAFTQCIIKQARGFSFFDHLGRESTHKLIWQRAVLEDIQDKIRVPKLIDFCRKKDDYYLIMEFIEGSNLHELVKKIHNNDRWPELSPDRKQSLLKLFLDAVTLVKTLHELGYAHRDITDVNFMVTPEGNMYLLDFELTSSIAKGLPDPPHGLGTFGYVSPEQLKSSKPDFTEDIYSLGALLLTILTRKHPVEALSAGIDKAMEELNTLTGNANMTTLIQQLLETEPSKRPTIANILACISEEIDNLEKEEIVSATDVKFSQKALLIK
ncbi:protein kinase domain-containing protein [Chitinophaga sp.]|uniref:protein kinase domain-containing protein n=1 Tax=Chitinophaga sp. TaxID=1869181 RepID=UPI002F9534E3